MISLRNNLNSTGLGSAGSADDAFAAMVRLDARRRPLPAPATPATPVPPGGPGGPLAPGDVVYSAKSIAKFLFNDEGRTARRRVYALWAHYRDRRQDVGFFKLKGALCLSKSRWARFQAG